MGSVISCNSIQESKTAKHTWEKIQSSDFSAPNERHEAAFVAVGDLFYLLGGRGIKPVDIFNPKTKEWTEGKEPPLELHHFQPVAVEHYIYILGAMAGPYPNEKPIEHIVIYDTQKDEWIRGADYPNGRLRGSTGVVKEGNDIYMICGIKDGHNGDHKKWVDKYDITTHQWTILPDAPRERDHFQAVVSDGKIYALAGRKTIAAFNPFKHTISEVDVFDIATNAWTTIENDIPTPRAGTAANILGEKIIVAGGESFYQATAHKEVEYLDTEVLEWGTMPELPIGRHGTGLIIYNNAFYTCSGSGLQGGGPELDDLYKLSIN